jgi:hypothetical protein
LDGFVPPTPYRWVDPPRELAPTNLAPTPGEFTVALERGGSETAVLTTGDAQVTLILPIGSFPPAPDQRAVEVAIRPLAPTAVEPPPGPNRIVGNVYRLKAAYRPSGDPARLTPDAGDGVRVVLVYPFEPNVHAGHEVIVSTDGMAWTAVDTNDLPSIQQADGPIPSLGYVAVAGLPPAVGGTAGDGGSSAAATIAIVAGLVVLLVGTAWALWPSRPWKERS